MKEFFFRFKKPLAIFVILVAFVWMSFPYFFSNQPWKMTKQFQVADISWTTELIGTANDFPDTRVVFLFSDEHENEVELLFPADICDNSDIKVGDFVYIYELRKGVSCVSKNSSIDSYKLKWKYYWRCDISPIKNTVIVILILWFFMQLSDSFEKKNKE